MTTCPTCRRPSMLGARHSWCRPPQPAQLSPFTRRALAGALPPQTLAPLDPWRVR